MINTMSIMIKDKSYADFGEMARDIKSDTVLDYYLVVNGEEVHITKTMAFGMTAFFDEYNRDVCKLPGYQE